MTGSDRNWKKTPTNSRGRYSLLGIILIIVITRTGWALPIVSDPQLLAPLQTRQNTGLVLIDIAGRTGADAFKGLNEQYRQGDYDAIVKRARAVIADDANSGLAYEILGTALYMLDQETEALEALAKASQLEPRQSGPYVKIGIIHLKQGRIDEAQQDLEKALKVNPHDRNALQHLGLIYEHKQDYPDAIVHYRKGLEGTGATFYGIALNLARLLNQEKRYDEAIDVLAPRLPISSDIVEGHMLLAASYYQTSQFKVARDRFERVLALQPDSREARLGLGMALRKSGDAAAALKQFEALLKKDPDWRAALMEYGETLLVMDQLDKARAAFDKGIALGSNPVLVEKRLARYHLSKKEFDQAETNYRNLTRSGKADAEVYTQLSELLQARGEYDEGLAVLKQGVQTYPENGYLQLRLGNYLASLQRYAEAVSVLQKARQTAPSDPFVLRSLSLAQAKAGDAAGSLDTAARLYEIQPENTASAILYATRLQAAGQNSQAKAVYQRVLKDDQANVIVLNNLADLLADNGELAEAEVKAIKAAELAPDNGMVLDTLGWIQYRQGKTLTAFETLGEAHRKLPNNPTILYHYGLAAHDLGHDAKARESLQRAIEIDPDFNGAEKARQLLTLM